MHDMAAFGPFAIDHLGLVVPDVSPCISALRGAGLLVSDPVELAGPDGPMNQVGAHCVFENTYLEIAAPSGGKPNHLAPLLAHGPGLRILALRSADAAADHVRLDNLGLADGPMRESSRAIVLAEGSRKARFRWFAAGPPVPGLLTVIVEHLDREIVFAPELRAHPRGPTRLDSVIFGQRARGLAPLARDPGDGPDIRKSATEGSLGTSLASADLAGGRLAAHAPSPASRAISSAAFALDSIRSGRWRAPLARACSVVSRSPPGSS